MVLDRVRPTVVVRRRVYDVPSSSRAPATPLIAAPHDDDNGPPSSVNVARALRSLRADELRRVEELVRNDDEPPPPPPPPPPAPTVPTVRVGRTIALADLARAMSVPKQELVTALVTRGFFSVTVKTVLPRDTARIAAAMFNWRVEDDDTPAPNAIPKPPLPAANRSSKKNPPPKKSKANALRDPRKGQSATKRNSTKKPKSPARKSPTKRATKKTSRRS